MLKSNFNIQKFNLKIQFCGGNNEPAEIILSSDFIAPSFDEAKAFGKEVSEIYSEKYNFIPEFHRIYESIVTQIG